MIKEVISLLLGLVLPDVINYFRQPEDEKSTWTLTKEKKDGLKIKITFEDSRCKRLCFVYGLLRNRVLKR